MEINEHQHLLDEAMQRHQQGHLAEAELLYKTVLQQEPQHFTAMHLLGVVACQQQRYEDGIDLVKHALVLNPRSSSALMNLANAFEQIGQDKAAAISIAQLLEFEPSHHTALIKMASLLDKLNLNTQALFFLDKAIGLEKANADCYLIKGNILLKQKNPSEALINFKKTISLKPDCIDAYGNAGTALMMLNDSQGALHYYDQALAIDPDNKNIKHNRELALHVQGDINAAQLLYRQDEPLSIQHLIDQSEVLIAINYLSEAIDHIQHAICQYPDSKELRNRAGLVWLTANKYKEALNSFKKAIDLDPNYIEAMINAAHASVGLFEFQQAIDMCKRVLAFDPDNIYAINNMGSALNELNQREQALVQFHKALDVDPQAEFAKLNLAFSYLSMGNYQQGLPLYEARWQGNLLKSRFYIPKPMWSGKESLKDRVIFLYGEQGYGDSFQFVRYVKLVAEQTPHILLGINDSIKSLFKRSYPFVELTDKSKPLPDLDYYCPLGSLPLAFSTTINTIPADVPYLVADNQLVDKWRKKINTKKPRIGIAWRGNPDNPVEIKRAIPLIELMSIADLDVELFSLKIDITKDEQLILDKYQITSFDDIRDFDDTAAIIQNLDLVISTDTAVAHLAGALGKSVWMMLAFVADWRWHMNRTDSPWYPNATLFRQIAIGDWQTVVKNVKTNLEKWLNQYHIL